MALRRALATRVRFATIDCGTGKLTLERSAIDLTRAWPDGWREGLPFRMALFSVIPKHKRGCG